MRRKNKGQREKFHAADFEEEGWGPELKNESKL